MNSNKPAAESSKVQLPTQEELQMIRDSVLLPFMLTMVDNNAKELDLSTSLLKKLYLAASQVLMDRIHKELARINRELRARKIKVYKDDQEHDELRFKYICRGYEDSFAIMREVAKANISVMMAEYIKNVMADLNP